MSNLDSMAQAYCGCPVRPAPEIRGDSTDTITEHVSGCADSCADVACSKIWACPNGCGYHIADGPVSDGEMPTHALISDHLEYECEKVGRNEAGFLGVDYPGLITVDTTDDVTGDSTTSIAMTPAQRVAVGLRELADFLDANPDLAGLDVAFQHINLFPRSRAAVAEWARAAMRAQGKASKYQSDTYAGLNIEFGPAGGTYVSRPVELAIRIARDEVCTRVVTGTREVTEEVPDPSALAAVPKVQVTKTVEDITWECMSLLANLPGGTA